MSQDQQQKSGTSSDRKDRILEFLFHRRFETETKLNLFRGLLETFSGYVKIFQSESPLIHTLHSRMVQLIREFLGLFIKPENIPQRPSQLVKLDITDRALQKSNKDMALGDFAFIGINKARIDKRCHHWVNDLYSKLRNGYVLAGKKLLAMPLTNKTLRLLRVMDPVFVGHQQTATSFQRLASFIPSYTTDQELMGKLASETIKYNVDADIKQLADDFKPTENIDTGFWVKVFTLESFDRPRYPAMKSLVTALLTIFSGPLVESSFNIMDDIVEKDRASLTVENYEAVAIIKCTLRKRNLKGHTMKVDSTMKRSCINAYSTYRAHLQKKKELKQLQLQQKLSVSVLQLKAEKAKKVQKLLRLKKRVLGKRQHEKDSISSSSKRWKRIKCN